MLLLIIPLLIVGTSCEFQYLSTEERLLLDLNNHIQVIMDAAKYYLHEGAPSITKLFNVDNPEEIRRLEGELKQKILENLLNQLVDLWAEMNMRVLKGQRVLKSLRDKADALLKEIKRSELADFLDGEGMKRRIEERVKELLEEAKEVFCYQITNLTESVFEEQKLLNLTMALDYDHVKIQLLKLVYDHRNSKLMNITSDMDREEYEKLEETWVMLGAWSKWSVLDLMAFIKSPLEDMQTDVQLYLVKLMINMQAIIDKTLEDILKIVAERGGDRYNMDRVNLYSIITKPEDPLYVLCKQ